MIINTHYRGSVHDLQKLELGKGSNNAQTFNMRSSAVRFRVSELRMTGISFVYSKSP